MTRKKGKSLFSKAPRSEFDAAFRHLRDGNGKEAFPGIDRFIKPVLDQRAKPWMRAGSSRAASGTGLTLLTHVATDRMREK
jgi:hypothetical protein